MLSIYNSKIKHLVFNNLSSLNIKFIDQNSSSKKYRDVLLESNEHLDIKSFGTSMKYDTLNFNSGILTNGNKLILNLRDIESVTFNRTYVDIEDACVETNKTKYNVISSVLKMTKIRRKTFELFSVNSNIVITDLIMNNFIFSSKKTCLVIHNYFINYASLELYNDSLMKLRKGYMHMLTASLTSSKLEKYEKERTDTFIYNANLNLSLGSYVYIDVFYYINYHLKYVNDSMTLNCKKFKVILDVEERSSLKGYAYDCFDLIDMNAETNSAIDKEFKTGVLIYPSKLLILNNYKLKEKELIVFDNKKEELDSGIKHKKIEVIF